MVYLHSFQPPIDQNIKMIDNFAEDQVPLHWGGVVALFKPNEGPKRTKFYTAYWFANKKGKYITKAFLIKSVGNKKCSDCSYLTTDNMCWAIKGKADINNWKCDFLKKCDK